MRECITVLEKYRKLSLPEHSTCYLRTQGGGGRYAETELLLSRTLHVFTRETQQKCRANWSGRELQATIIADVSEGGAVFRQSVGTYIFFCYLCLPLVIIVC